MKKIISLILLFCLSFNVLADSGALKELERELDSFNYAMTVEWDQKDKAFASAETKKFLTAIDKLIAEKKLGAGEIELLMKARIKNPELLQAVQLKAGLLGASPAPEKVLELLKSTSDDLYQRGASWNGNAQTLVIVGVVVVIVAILIAKAAWHDANHVCTKYDQAEQCVDEYDCRGETCYYDGTYCGIITRCTKEERKE